MMPIHLFNARRVATELHNGQVSARQRGYYFLALSLVSLAFGYSGFISPNPLWSWLSIYEAVVQAVILILGLSKAYEAAGGDTNANFVSEFTCLCLPVSLTTSLAVWGSFWAISLGFREAILALSDSHLQLAVNLSRIGGDFFGLLAFLAVALTEAVLFYRIIGLFKVVRGEADGG